MFHLKNLAEMETNKDLAQSTTQASKDVVQGVGATLAWCNPPGYIAKNISARMSHFAEKVDKVTGVFYLWQVFFFFFCVFFLLICCFVCLCACSGIIFVFLLLLCYCFLVLLLLLLVSFVVLSLLFVLCVLLYNIILIIVFCLFFAFCFYGAASEVRSTKLFINGPLCARPSINTRSSSSKSPSHTVLSRTEPY